MPLQCGRCGCYYQCKEKVCPECMSNDSIYVHKPSGPKLEHERIVEGV